MFCLSPTGDLLWTLEAEPGLVDRGGEDFEKAWTFKHVAVAKTPGRNFIWAALANEAGWAGCVLRVAVNGEACVKLANTGYVEKLGLVSLGGEQCLIACGENNAFEQAFVTLLGVDDPPCCSPLPGRYPRYRYENAPDGAPRKYILFPRTELIMAREKPYGHALELRVFPDAVIVKVETGGDSGHFLYHFSVRLNPKYVFPSGSHEFCHAGLERAGVLDHSWEACPEKMQPLILDIWEPESRWRKSTIPWRDDPWHEK